MRFNLPDDIEKKKLSLNGLIYSRVLNNLCCIMYNPYCNYGLVR